MRRIKVAFIDDGINARFVPLNIPFQAIETADGGMRTAVTINKVTHGTACYNVFKERVNVPYDLISIKILNNKTRNGSKNNLITALDWCRMNGISLVNMSLGTNQFADRLSLYDASQKLAAAGTITVAACNNSNTVTFPACFPFVIGVRHYSSSQLINDHVYIKYTYDFIDVMTYAGEDQTQSFGESNSLAAPVITAKVCGYLAAGIKGMKAVRECLSADALNEGFSFGFDRYKSLLREWRDIDIPVVGITGYKKSKREAARWLRSLVAAFCKDEFNAVVLSNILETSVRDGVYRLKDTEWINFYYNFLQPDILFLHMEAKGIESQRIKGLIDMVVDDPKYDNVLTLCSQIKNIFNAD